MILVAGALIVFATVPLLGGRLERVGAVRFQQVAWLMAALAIQVVVLQVAAEALAPRAAAVLHVASYALAVCFVWWNRSVPGLLLIGLGGLCNLLAIAANGGVMPASPAARAAAGIAAGRGFENSAVVVDPQLAFLGDVFAWPAPLPLANVFSAGDVVLMLGTAVLVHRVGGSRLPLRLRRAPLPL